MLFRLVSLMLPVLVLALAEVVLRVCGLGGYAPIIRKVGPVSDGMLVATDQAGAASWFFANPDRPGYNDQYSFVDPKPTNTTRIFLVGESAAKGYPEPRNLAASAFLQAMLTDVWPGRKVEVINLGTTAVASYPVLGIMTEALAFTPDLIIVSTGHNEFFGTYGVASVGRAGSRPWMLAVTRFIHSLAIVQALSKLTSPKPPEGNVTLMERMVGRAHIAPDDWRRSVAANSLHHNVREMIARCQARGVPVLVCTQPSNERGLAPIGQDKLDELPEEQRQRILELATQGQSLLATDAAAARGCFQSALEVFPAQARTWFLLGQAMNRLHQNVESAAAFEKARDLDSMPWRAPAAANDAIRRAARESHAPICDLEDAFRTNSPSGSIGWELMDDHVHPTLRGQALIAETIVDSLSRFTGTLEITPLARTRIGPWEDYARQLGDNRYDRYAVAHSMRVIFDVPFMRENNPEAYERFDQIANGLENSEPPEIQAVLREYQTFRPHAGAKRPITGMVARVLLRQQRVAEALELYEIAQRSVPAYTSWYLEYVYFALSCKEKLSGTLNQPARELALDAIAQGKFLLRHGYSETGFTERYVGRLHQLRGEFGEAVPFLIASRQKLSGLDLVAADQALAVSYLRTRQFDKARELLSSGATNAGQYAAMYENYLKELPALEQTMTAASTNTPVREGQ